MPPREEDPPKPEDRISRLFSDIPEIQKAMDELYAEQTAILKRYQTALTLSSTEEARKRALVTKQTEMKVASDRLVTRRAAITKELKAKQERPGEIYRQRHAKSPTPKK